MNPITLWNTNRVHLVPSGSCMIVTTRATSQESGRIVTLHRLYQRAGRGDTGACWHPPRASVYSDKITHGAMSWWGHSGTLYLRVKTLTNLPPRLRSVKGSKCTWVCQRRTQRVDMGPYQAWWRNGHRTITASHQLCPQRGLGVGLGAGGEVPQGNVRWPSSHSAAPDALPFQNWPPNSSGNDTC